MKVSSLHQREHLLCPDCVAEGKVCSEVEQVGDAGVVEISGYHDAEGQFAQPPFGSQRKKSRVEQMGRSTPTSSWPLLKPGGDAAWRTWASKPLGASIIPNPALDGACRPKRQ